MKLGFNERHEITADLTGTILLVVRLREIEMSTVGFDFDFRDFHRDRIEVRGLAVAAPPGEPRPNQ